MYICTLCKVIKGYPLLRKNTRNPCTFWKNGRRERRLHIDLTHFYKRTQYSAVYKPRNDRFDNRITFRPQISTCFEGPFLDRKKVTF